MRRFKGAAYTIFGQIMRTRDTRGQHSRDHLAYPSNLTDAEWQVVAAYVPASLATGRPRRWSWRGLLDAILFVLRTGAPWRCLPPGFRHGRRPIDGSPG